MTTSTPKGPSGMFGLTIVLIGQALSILASSMTGFALSIWIFQQTSSATSLGIMQTAFILPYLLIIPLAGVMVLSEPAALSNGVTLPVGSAVGLTENGRLMMMPEGWSESFGFEWGFEEKGMVPKYIPYIGGQNLVEFTVSAEGKADATGATVSGEVGGEVSMFGEQVTGGVTGGLSAIWGMNPKVCVYDFWQAQLQTSLTLKGKILLYTFEGVVAHVEAGLQAEGTLSGDLIWKRSTGSWPDGSVTGSLELELYGESNVFFGLAEVAVEGGGTAEVMVDKNGFNALDFYLNASAESRLGSMVQKVEWRYPPEKDNLAAQAATQAVGETIYAPVQVAYTQSLAAYTGTGNVYGSYPLLVDVASDRIDDTRPVLARNNESIYAFWIRSSSDPTVNIGDTIHYAVYAARIGGTKHGRSRGAVVQRPRAAARRSVRPERSGKVPRSSSTLAEK